MKSQQLTCQVDVAMMSTLYLPERTDPAPGVLVFPDIFGLGEHAYERAARLAELGYAALAVDIHGERRILQPDAIMPSRSDRVDRLLRWRDHFA